ncbi:hypothetical protein STRDD11_02309 [Streptococcus sp. DD11]|uniref:ubiquitin carboxyl-hydrolase n=1 Tax=Streptococcus sp. DD11 TaxID=1777879 RepID=UPI000798834D|nr:ubiquitin carboxyl-hydrolase [Streptococcus sp. DD11]KXT79362.1 hypothetical protein STRDD11_02309 [Streptococcus sp. DD11]
MKISKLLLAAFIGFLAIGILSACNLQKKTEQKREVTLTAEEKKQIRKQEEALALFLINHYEGIKKIEFLSVSRKPFAQSRRVSLKVNDEINLNSYLEDDYNNGYSLACKKGERPLIKKEAATSVNSLEGVEVIYNLGE